MPVIDTARPAWKTDDLVLFEEEVYKFFSRELSPHVEKWREQGCVDRWAWEKAGEAGLLCMSMPEEYGGAGGTFAHEQIFCEQQVKAGVEGFGAGLHNCIVAPYILHYGTEEQKKRWLPRMAKGELVGAIAMTEPGTGSDLQGVKTTAIRDGNQYVINGQKTFITNGQTANLVIVVAKTDPREGAKGVSLMVVETDEVEGFRRGRNLKKLGMKAQDTSELFFDDVRVPTENLLGTEEGQGFIQLMQQLPQERQQIAVLSIAAIERALELTVDYVKQRHAFGKPVIAFQNTQFKLAEAKAKATMARVFVDYCTGLLIEGRLDAATASMSKMLLTDLENEIIDECLQLFGGYGYMDEYPISRMYADARVQRIYGGTNEIMKLLIARTL
ncbi:acyl-CoA dehydrogenase family protein [Amphiplicatus metriothermophilus]|uniref:Acyl-[acyl-carrier-protein] dehydrogenase MbtN n=1 Tax=Amphiplicatus metriothermophilus TaxID=1519374 RepID=A0A239PXW1_9PROT|nr:acyl-CoA dehydrogenase family protein [Amphiplicatus metriothermophilus]MBB5519835.1 acyl-CoA dehydrogenase [Amphiplicatus metriothermophilus]SNT75114.1 acyl-CoA dehydrogenase [Amphiplicatus metriothermophilus]